MLRAAAQSAAWARANIAPHVMVQLMAFALTLLSALFLSCPSASSPTDIADAQGVYLGWNPHLVRSLSSQSADAHVGIGLLVVATALQGLDLSGLLTGERRRPTRRELQAALLLGVVVWVLGVGASRWLAARIESQSFGILYKQNPETPRLTAPEAKP